MILHFFKRICQANSCFNILTFARSLGKLRPWFSTLPSARDLANVNICSSYTNNKGAYQPAYLQSRISGLLSKSFEPRHKETCFLHMRAIGADLLRIRTGISALVVRCFDRPIPLVFIPEFSSLFSLASACTGRVWSFRK